ncbi:MAG: hypothetical protein AB1697_10270 [Pseudomonadota bacterium]
MNKLLRGRIAALRGAHSLAYLIDMSRSLCSVRLALHPARGFLQRFLRFRRPAAAADRAGPRTACPGAGPARSCHRGA